MANKEIAANKQMPRTSFLCKIAGRHVRLQVLGPVWDGGYTAHCKSCQYATALQEQSK